MDGQSIPPLGMTGEQFKEAANGVISDVENYYANLSSRQVVPSIAPGYLQKLLPASPPEAGESWDAIEADMEAKIMPGITHWQSPNFMAFYPASSTYPGILGEIWSAALTAPAFNWICSPAVTELETIVLDWLAQTLALPETFTSRTTGGGVIQGSASEAIVTCMVAARERYIRRHLSSQTFATDEDREDAACELRSKLVALSSDQTHSSTAKAAIIAGTRHRSIPCTQRTNFSLTGPALRAKILELRSRGLHPYYLTISLGTTATCAIDDLPSITAISQEFPDIWIHVDAAYAGAALILPENHHLSAQMRAFDSFNLNLHKWLLVNFDASCLYIQNRRDLTSALSISPSYLQNAYTDSGLVTDYRDWQIPLGRRFRSLKIWFVMRTYGTKGMREHVQRHLRLGDVFVDLVRGRSDLFGFLAKPGFALGVVFVRPGGAGSASGFEWKDESAEVGGKDPRPDWDGQVAVETEPGLGDQELATANEVTKRVYELIDERKEFFLTSSVIGGVYGIRVVSANPLAEEKYIRRVFEVLVETAEEVLAERRGRVNGSGDA
ncbi:hypothetical protein MBLNU230_g4494t1 [Neophaeotheca triangularis]